MVVLASVFSVHAQETVQDEEQDEIQGEVQPEERIAAVPPRVSPSLVYVEAEQAVSTNFAREATLHFSASGSRTLQLNTPEQQYRAKAYFAEYVVYVPQAGTYTLWYGGSPPGPSDEFSPSYISPFTLSIDAGQPLSVYREDIAVVEEYTVGLYWNRAVDITLDEGVHTLRFEVSERRRLDNRFVFVLDAFFLLNTAYPAPGEEESPPLFPEDLANRSIDNPFRTIVEYEQAIQGDPDNPGPRVQLSKIYTLIGDYREALRYLTQARLLAPDRMDILLLIARNWLWYGDVQAGLNGYRNVLSRFPDNPAVWSEAAKIAAWFAEYRQSEELYKEALSYFGDDLNLMVNLGLLYLWTSRPREAQALLLKARELAMADPYETLDLGSVLDVNGYPDEAAEVYRSGIVRFPAHIEIGMALVQSYRAQGKNDEARELLNQIKDRYVLTDELLAYLETQEIRDSIVEGYLDEFRQDLVLDPENLVLREEFVQALFWNGLKEEAIKRAHESIAVRAWEYFRSYDVEHPRLMGLLARTGFDALVLRQAHEELEELAVELTGLTKELDQARRNKEKREAVLSEAKTNGTVPPPLKGDDPFDVYSRLSARLEAINRRAGSVTAAAVETESRLSGYAGELDGLRTGEETLEANFDQGAGGWDWDRDFWRRDLEGMDMPLAGKVLAAVEFVSADCGNVIFREEDQPASDQEFFLTALRRSLRAVCQKDARNTTVGARVQLFQDLAGFYRGAGGYLPDSDLLAGRAAEYALAFSVADQSGAETQAPDPTVSTAEDIKAVGDRVSSSFLRAKELLAEFHRMYAAGIRRMFYALETETAPLRYELGDFYMSLSRMDEATRSFLMVLSVDPRNVSAVFKLGTVRELAGDWYQAMAYYRMAHSMDPGFAGAVRNHNSLAQTHPDWLRSSVESAVDTSRLTTAMTVGWTRRLNSRVDLQAEVTADSLKIYRYMNSLVPDSGAAYTVKLSAPVHVYGLGLDISPSVGFQAASEFEFWDNPVVNNENVDFSEYTDSLAVFPAAGLNVAYRAPHAAVTAGLRYDHHRDSLLFGNNREPIPVLTLSSDAFVSFGMFSPSWSLGSFRASVSGRFLDDPQTDSVNRLTTIGAEALAGVHLKDSPWWNLQAAVSGVYETAQYPSRPRYYAPDSVLSLKAGLVSGTWFAAGAGKSIGLSARVQGGSYGKYLFGSDQTFAPLLDGELRLEYTVKQATVFIRAFGTTTFTSDPDLDYWMLGCTAGMNIAVADVLGSI